MPHCCIASEIPFTCRVRQMPLEGKLSTKGHPSQIRCRAEIYSGMTRPQSTPQKTLTVLCCIASEIPFTALTPPHPIRPHTPTVTLHRSGRGVADPVSKNVLIK